MKINIPDDALHIINKLNMFGHDAYVVGGCVRDSIMGRIPQDWDICTSALPNEICSIFDKVIPTGIQHGTITVLVNSVPYEVTTYRIDGEYSNNRVPDNVEFTDSLAEDLKRRDFTINAMAYNPYHGLCDIFGGQDDLKNGIIRCVGNPDERFCEDALRILRAWRFSCNLGFDIEPTTLKSAKKHIDLLKNISAERIRTEFTKALCGSFVKNVMCDDTFLRAILPEWADMYINQNNPHHIYDVAYHTLTALNGVITSSDIIIKLAVLLHDIGKPYCYTEDENGIGHFYGHSKISADIADKFLSRLKFDNRTRTSVVELILRHDALIDESSKAVKKQLGRLGEEQFFRLLKIKYADIIGQNPEYSAERIAHINKLKYIADTILAENQCFKIKDLAINGNDLIAIGYERNKSLGNALNTLLDMVIGDKVQNTKDELLKIAIELK